MGVLAGLAAALAWTVASSLWRGLSTSLNALQLNGLKNAIASLLLLPVLLSIPWSSQPGAWSLLLVSGAIGIAAGDSFYLGALRRLGTRRTLTVEALSPLMAAISGLVWMGESLSTRTWLGAALVTVSVLLVAGQEPPQQTQQADRGRTAQLLGLTMALMAVVCGVGGAALSRSVLLNTEVQPLQSAAIRLLGGLVALLPWLGLTWKGLPKKRFPKQNIPTVGIPGSKPGDQNQRWRVLRVVIATLLGTNLGLLLQQTVLQQLPLAVAITVLSTAPVMALLVASQEGDHPQRRGLIASVLAVTGVAVAVLD